MGAACTSSNSSTAAVQVKARENAYQRDPPPNDNTGDPGNKPYELPIQGAPKPDPSAPISAPIGNDGYTDLSILNDKAETDDDDDLQYDDFVGTDKKKNCDAEASASDLLKKYSKDSKQKYGKKHKHANKALVMAPANASLMPGMIKIKAGPPLAAQTPGGGQNVFNNGRLAGTKL